jgi:hypothetical protein
VFPLITGVVIVGLVARTTEPEPVPVIAPPRVRLPEVVTVPLRVNPLTVPVPLTEVTVPDPPPVAVSVPLEKLSPEPTTTLLNPPDELPYRIDEPDVAGA